MESHPAKSRRLGNMDDVQAGPADPPDVFTWMPLEILFMMLHSLDIYSVGRFAQASRVIYNITQSMEFWDVWYMKRHSERKWSDEPFAMMCENAYEACLCVDVYEYYERYQIIVHRMLNMFDEIKEEFIEGRHDVFDEPDINICGTTLTIEPPKQNMQQFTMGLLLCDMIPDEVCLEVKPNVMYIHALTNRVAIRCERLCNMHATGVGWPVDWARRELVSIRLPVYTCGCEDINGCACNPLELASFRISLSNGVTTYQAALLVASMFVGIHDRLHVGFKSPVVYVT